MKNKIALVVDADDWAYANIARNISKRLKNYYDFEIIPSQYFSDQLGKVLLLTKDADLIHFFWRGKLLGFDYWDFKHYVKTLGFKEKEFLERYWEGKTVTTAVYDHLYLDDSTINNTINIVSRCKDYYVSSNRLKKIYNGLDLPKYPKCVITDGIDLDEFYPINLKRLNNTKNRKLVIGWVGNSAWEEGTEDFKGVNTILKPVVNELIDEGYDIEMYFADRQERMIPHDEMVNYYSKIDIYVCVSKIEGTPNPVLESMACGVPIISTDVGIVPDVFGKKQKEYILPERNKEELKKKLIYLYNNREKLKELSDENLKEIKKWSWDNIALQMKDFFDSVLEEE